MRPQSCFPLPRKALSISSAKQGAGAKQVHLSQGDGRPSESRKGACIWRGVSPAIHQRHRRSGHKCEVGPSLPRKLESRASAVIADAGPQPGQGWHRVNDGLRRRDRTAELGRRLHLQRRTQRCVRVSGAFTRPVSASPSTLRGTKWEKPRPRVTGRPTLSPACLRRRSRGRGGWGGSEDAWP